MLEVVSWDVDGTLYSLPRLRLAVGLAVLRGLPGSYGELVELERWRAAMEAVRTAGGRMATWEGRDRVRELERRWYGAALRTIGVRPAFLRLWSEFRRLGVRQVVLSDYEAGYKLEALGLTGRFDAVYSGESVGWLKPSRELYREVGQRLGVDPSRWLHIGDRMDRDVEPARAVGAKARLL